MRQITTTHLDIFIYNNKPFHPFSNSLHKHHAYEVYIVVSGNCRYYINGNYKEFTAGITYIIDKNTYHSLLHHSDDYKSIVFQISKEPVAWEFKNDPLVTSCLLRELPQGNLGKIKALFEVLSYDYLGITADPTRRLDLHNQIYEYFNNMYFINDISLSRMATDLGFSERQLSRYLKEYMKDTFKSILAKYRIESAKELLQHTEMKISEIAETVGYNSYTNFFDTFKKMEGMTPESFRKTYSAKDPMRLLF